MKFKFFKILSDFTSKMMCHHRHRAVVSFLLLITLIYSYANYTAQAALAVRNGRYSYFWSLEYPCTDKCRRYGKPFGRLIGTVCKCYCPMPDDVDGCSGDSESCSLLCKRKKYHSGYCLFQDKCFCFCSPRQHYDPTGSAIALQYSKRANNSTPLIRGSTDKSLEGNISVSAEPAESWESKINFGLLEAKHVENGSLSVSAAHDESTTIVNRNIAAAADVDPDLLNSSLHTAAGAHVLIKNGSSSSTETTNSSSSSSISTYIWQQLSGFASLIF